MSDRKYRHNGYMDGGAGSGKRSPREPREFRPERLEGAPRGRTAGGFGPAVFKCALCGSLQRAIGAVEKETVCSKCGGDLHTCTNCKQFDSSSRWECREEIPKRVKPKDRRNDCELFDPKIVRDLIGDKGEREPAPDDARAAFENLFKK